MSDEQLKVDLEALRKLSKQLDESAKKLTTAADSPPKVPSGDSPLSAAVRRLATQAVPTAQRTIAGRLTNIAEVSVQARNGFGDTEEHVRQLIESVTPLSRGTR